MFTIITNTGDYREINAATRSEADTLLHLMYSEEEIKDLEAEIIEKGE